MTLFEKYGGFKNVSRIVMAFYEQALDSEQIGGFFENVDMPRLIDHQTKFIASLMGGPASFGDEQLRRVHANLGIGHDDFDEMTSLLSGVLADHGVEAGDVKEVLRAMEARRPVVVDVL